MMKVCRPTCEQTEWRRGVRSGECGGGRPERRLARRVPVKREGSCETTERGAR